MFIMSGAIKCSVPGCKMNSLRRHRLPNVRKDFNNGWILYKKKTQRIAARIYIQIYVCHVHSDKKILFPRNNTATCRCGTNSFSQEWISIRYWEGACSSQSINEMPSVSNNSEEQECNQPIIIEYYFLIIIITVLHWPSTKVLQPSF